MGSPVARYATRAGRTNVATLVGPDLASNRELGHRNHVRDRIQFPSRCTIRQVLSINLAIFKFLFRLK